jgi:hypothetical protein
MKILRLLKREKNLDVAVGGQRRNPLTSTRREYIPVGSSARIRAGDGHCQWVASLPSALVGTSKEKNFRITH